MEADESLYRRWLPALARDPAYNRNLSLEGAGFTLERPEVPAWQPLFGRSPLPRVLAHPADPYGCGHYRVRQPFRALHDAGLLDGMLSESLLQPVALERLEVDSVILQRQISEEQLRAISRMRSFNRAFRVYELDDYLPELPLKSLNSARDARRHSPDPRSCPGPGGPFRGLDRTVGGGIPAHARGHPGRAEPPSVALVARPFRRRDAERPRVGWAGGIGHGGDLQVIAEVVRELADEVDWVFFGFCPDRSVVPMCANTIGVEIERYPAYLASLDLDLALAPLEQNRFNELARATCASWSTACSASR
ncbi:hypothetical protein ACG3RN_25725 [Pseudomonas aeruginosa]